MNKQFAKWKGKRQDIWSQSSYGDFQLCEYYYYLRKHRRLVSNVRPEKQAPLWGKLWHSTTDVYDKALFYNKSRKEALDEAIQFALLQKPKLNQSDFDGKWDNSRTINTLVRSICWYSDKYADDPIKVAALPNGEPAIEIRFEVPVPGSNKRIEGILDRVVYFDSSQYILDRKSTSRDLSSWYFKDFAPNNQSTEYIWALREQLGMPIAGFIVDACQVLVSGSRFARQTFDVTKSQTTEWIETFKSDMVNADKCAKSGIWKQRFASCSMYGGCDFRSICARSPEWRETYLEADFQERQQDEPKKSISL